VTKHSLYTHVALHPVQSAVGAAALAGALVALSAALHRGRPSLKAT
jgi:hypothetical protein